MDNNPSDDRSPKRFSLGLRSKMLLYFGLLFALTITVMLVVQIYGLPYSSFQGIYNQEQAQVFQNLNLLADLKKERLEQWIKERKSDTKALSENSYVKSSLVDLQSLIQEYNARDTNDDELWSKLQTDKAYQALMKETNSYRFAYGCYEAIRIADAQSGTIIFSTRTSELGSSVKEHDDFINALFSEEVFLSIDRILGQRHYDLHITKSIKEGNTLKKEGQQTIAVLEMVINPDAFIQPLLHTGKGLGRTGEVFLINQNRGILTSLKHPLADGSIAKVLEYRITGKPAILAARGEEGIINANDYRGVPVLAAYRHIRVTSEIGWGLVVKRDQVEVFAPLRNNLISLSIIALVSIAIIISVVSFFASTLSRPISTLGHIAHQVETGNFSVRAHASTTGEIGALAKTFNSMIERIQNWHEELENEVRIRTNELGKASQELKLEILERKRAEEALQKAHDELESKVEERTLLLREANIELGRKLEEEMILQNQLVKSERLAATGQLATSVAHEINSPLQAVTSTLNMLKKIHKEDKELLDNIDLLKGSFFSIRDTVKRLLDLSRPDKGRKQSANINKIIEDTEMLVRSHLKSSGIKLNLSLSPNIPDIPASVQQMSQVFLNLINNAVEAMTGRLIPKDKEGFKSQKSIGRVITIKTDCRERDIIITVSDTGPGISKKDLEHIFDPFYTKKKQMGIGIGLSICHDIIEDHNGTIEAKNSDEGGAVITITLPVIKK